MHTDQLRRQRARQRPANGPAGVGLAISSHRQLRVMQRQQIRHMHKEVNNFIVQQQQQQQLKAGPIAGGTSAGDAAVWQAFRQLSWPERLRAAKQMSVEDRAAIRAAGVPEEAMEDSRVFPALQRLGGHGPPIEVGHNRRCGHCGVLKPRAMYSKYMWGQPAHRSVCPHCETHRYLKCYTCPG